MQKATVPTRAARTPLASIIKSGDVMKDAKGHGSNPRGAAHQAGVNAIAGPEHLVSVDSVRPRPENTAMIDKLNKVTDDREAAFKAAYPGEPYERQGPAEAIAAYRVRIRAGEKLPPLAVNRDRSIADGEHRWRAYKAEGIKQIPVRVIK